MAGTVRRATGTGLRALVLASALLVVAAPAQALAVSAYVHEQYVHVAAGPNVTLTVDDGDGDTVEARDGTGRAMAGQGCWIEDEEEGVVRCRVPRDRGVPFVYVHGSWGADRVVEQSRLSVVFDGDHGDDEIFAGGGDDTLYGGPGTDVLRGEGGDDEMAGEDGADELIGGSGLDRVRYWGPVGVTANLDGLSGDGRPGENDRIAADVEVLEGGEGDDHLTGNGDENRLFGDDGVDVLDGGGGRDVVIGNWGDDRLTGGEGDDLVGGGGGDDRVEGGPGNDVLDWTISLHSTGGGEEAGTGRDELLGGPGNDRLEADGGSPDAVPAEGDADSLSGGDGEDAAWYDDRDGVVTVTPDGLANDGEALELDNVQDDVEGFRGGEAADRLVGGPTTRLLEGGPGDDTLTAGPAGVRMDGGPGADLLTGGPGDDEIYGSLGDDRIIGGDGVDTVRGNGGADDIDLRDPSRPEWATGYPQDPVGCGEDEDILRPDASDDARPYLIPDCERIIAPAVAPPVEQPDTGSQPAPVELDVLSRRLEIRRGLVRVRIRCTVPTGRSCALVLRLRGVAAGGRPGPVLAGGAVEAPSGRAVTVRLRPTRRGLAAFAAGRPLRGFVRAAVRGDGTSVTEKVRVAPQAAARAGGR